MYGLAEAASVLLSAVPPPLARASRHLARQAAPIRVPRPPGYSTRRGGDLGFGADGSGFPATRRKGSSRRSRPTAGCSRSGANGESGSSASTGMSTPARHVRDDVGLTGPRMGRRSLHAAVARRLRRSGAMRCFIQPLRGRAQVLARTGGTRKTTSELLRPNGLPAGAGSPASTSEQPRARTD